MTDQARAAQNKQLATDYERNRLMAIADPNLDIVPFPGEHPQDVVERAEIGALAVTNWGAQLYLTPELVARLKAECKFKVTAKVFDTGDTNHPDVADGRILGANYTTDPDATDRSSGHSTHVIGIMVAKDFGIARPLVEAGLLRWKACKVLSSPASGGTPGSGQVAWATAGLNGEEADTKAILGRGEFVVYNMSFGGGTAPWPEFSASMKRATDAGTVICAAAGNTGGKGVITPANDPNAIAVAALQNASPLTRAGFSTTGPQVLVAAPGAGIVSTFLNNGYANLSGTSMASPMQSALAAIALSRWGSKVAGEKMAKYAAWIAADLAAKGRDEETGWGVMMVKAILDMDPANMPGGPTPPPPPPPPPPADEPTHAVRDLVFSPAGNYTIYWGINGQVAQRKIADASDGEVRTFRTSRLMRTFNSTAGLSALKIKALVVRVNKSGLMAEAEGAKLKANLDWYFTNRGLALLAGSDFADALYWAAFFAEMICYTQRDPKQRQNLDVISIVGEDGAGNSVVLNFDALKHWTPPV